LQKWTALFLSIAFVVSDRCMDEGGGMVNGQSLDSMGRAIAKMRRFAIDSVQPNIKEFTE
jgi:hypothetical protein